MPKSTATPRPRRSKGEGAIYVTKDGRVRGSLLIPHPDGDRSVLRYVSGRTRAEVSRKLAALAEDAKAGFPTGEQTAAYLARWMADNQREYRASTYRTMEQHVRDYWTPTIGSVELVKLTPAHVRQAMASLTGRGLSAQTVQHARSTLRRALRDAMVDGLINRNVAALAKPKTPIERREMRALTPAEVGRLLDATADDAFGPFFAVAVGTGLRLGEMLGLTWDDVDLDRRQLTVRRSLARSHDGGYALGRPKTRSSSRTVMLPAMAVDGFRRQRTRQATARLAAGTAWQDRLGLVFTDGVGQPVNPRTPSKAFRLAADRLGLPVRLHDLRHTAASLMLANGVPLKVVSEALGHSSIVITADVYAHVTPDLKREAADAMDRALGGAS